MHIYAYLSSSKTDLNCMCFLRNSVQEHALLTVAIKIQIGRENILIRPNL